MSSDGGYCITSLISFPRTDLYSTVLPVVSPVRLPPSSHNAYVPPARRAAHMQSGVASTVANSVLSTVVLSSKPSVQVSQSVPSTLAAGVSLAPILVPSTPAVISYASVMLGKKSSYVDLKAGMIQTQVANKAVVQTPTTLLSNAIPKPTTVATTTPSLQTPTLLSNAIPKPTTVATTAPSLHTSTLLSNPIPKTPTATPSVTKVGVIKPHTFCFNLLYVSLFLMVSQLVRFMYHVICMY